MENTIKSDILFLMMIFREAYKNKRETSNKSNNQFLIKDPQILEINSYQEGISFSSTTSNEKHFSNLNSNSINNIFLQDKPISLSNISKETFKNKQNKINSACPHSNKTHYAKNMCKNCYHSKGREKKAWKCAHNNKAHYAKGMCQNCYQFRIKKEKKCVFPSQKTIN